MSNVIKIYIYDKTQIIDNYLNLPSQIISHCSIYPENKKLISLSNYFYLQQKLLENQLDNLDDIEFDKHGKPYLKNMNISISHSDSLFGFAISDKDNIGIDIEAIGRFNDKLSTKILNKEEIKEYNCCEDKSSYLAKKWCQKEALSKLIGTGLTKNILKQTPKYFKEFKIENNIIVLVSNQDIVYEIYLNDKLLLL